MSYSCGSQSVELVTPEFSGVEATYEQSVGNRRKMYNYYLVSLFLVLTFLLTLSRNNKQNLKISILNKIL